MSLSLNNTLPIDTTVVLLDEDILEAQLSEKKDSNFAMDMSLLQFFTPNMSSNLNDMLPMVITIEDSDEERRSKSEFSTDEGTNYGNDISISPNIYEK